MAVVVIDLGLSSAATEAAIRQFPGEVSLSFSPYAENLDRWVQRARGEGHEVLLNLPMEPLNYPSTDPGPQTLLTSLSARQNADRLEWVLGRANGGYVGVMAHLGSKFTTSAPSLKPVLETLAARGLLYLDSRAHPQSLGPALAAELGLPRAANDRLVDQEPARAAIDARLAEIERVARESGMAVALASPLPITYERLNQWLGTLQGKGLALAPITAIAARQFER